MKHYHCLQVYQRSITGLYWWRQEATLLEQFSVEKKSWHTKLSIDTQLEPSEEPHREQETRSKVENNQSKDKSDEYLSYPTL